MAVALVLAALALCALLLAVLLLPVRLTLRFESTTTRAEVRLALLGGLVPVTLLDSDRPRKAPRHRAPARPEVQGQGARPAHGDRGLRALRALPCLLLSVMRHLRVEGLRLDGTFGTGDPALTGQIYGMLTPLAFGASGCERLSVTIRPSFGSACLSGSGEGSLRFTPAALIGPLLRFGWAVIAPQGAVYR